MYASTRNRYPCVLRTLAAAAWLAMPPATWPQSTDEYDRRIAAEAEVAWRAPVSPQQPAKVRLLGFNDFHGHLRTSAKIEGPSGPRSFGGAAVLKAWLDQSRLPERERTLLLLAGDQIGASAPESGLLRDEPTIAFLNLLADGKCPPLTREWPRAAAPVATRCRTIATVGNHEFDRGTAELERLLYGGRHPSGPVLGRDWRGMRIPFVAANVVRREGQVPLLPESVIVDLDDVKVGVVGAVTTRTASLVPPQRIADLRFLPEAPAINAAVARLKAQGVRTIVLLLHEGLQSPVTPQPAVLQYDEVRGRLAEIARALEPGVDVIVSGDSHRYTNLLLPGPAGGKPILVVQARAHGTSFAEVDLTVDRATGAVVAKSSRIVTPWTDELPGAKPDRQVAKLVESAVAVTAVQEARMVGRTAAAIVRESNAAGESALGNLIADAQRAAAGTDFAFMNRDGIRADLDAGPVTWGELYRVQPFGNTVVKLTMTGEQLLRLLDQQWSGGNAARPRFLQVSGLRYVYDLRRPPGERIVDTADATGLPIDPARRYTVAANDFIVGGGDFYGAFAEGSDATPVMVDIEALEAFVRGAGGRVEARIEGRIQRR